MVKVHAELNCAVDLCYRPPYGTKCFGVAFDSFQSACGDSRRMMRIGGKVINLSNCLRFAPEPS